MKKFLFFIFIVLLIIFITYIFYFLNVIPHKSYDNNYFNIPTYKSNIDMDNDNVDDQTDILQNAKEYIKRRPKYKSKYYSTGYPNDEYGVCTDVIAISLLNSGYDLQELVYQDILQNKQNYDIGTIDRNIDFRRVRNLNIYFKNNHISLTTDITKIDEWQGGDIVVFKEHIGLISDKRNQNGIPFVIHHSNPFQIRYEEDILENRDDIIGHYRIS